MVIFHFLYCFVFSPLLANHIGMELTPEIRQLIRKRASELGTKQAFADLAGCFPGQVRKWIEGPTKTVKDEKIAGLAYALGMSQIDLIALANGAGSSIKGDEVQDDLARLYKWLRSQPAHIQEPFLKMGEGFGFR